MSAKVVQQQTVSAVLIGRWEQVGQKLTALADEWFNKALETRKKNAEKKKGTPVGNS